MMNPVWNGTVKLLGILFLVSITACENNSEEPAITDEQLYELAKSNLGFKWYGNSESISDASPGSEHGMPYYRTRFDEIASSKLDEDGIVIAGSIFPEKSLIVKELYDSSMALSIYAVRYKDPGDKNADARGWVWGYLNADGSVREPAANRGSMCIDCHTRKNNIDYVLLNLVSP